jgi:hypothetical protein
VCVVCVCVSVCVCVLMFSELFKQITFTTIPLSVMALEDTPTPYISFHTLSRLTIIWQMGKHMKWQRQ